jgi:hypothetical protein
VLLASVAGLMLIAWAAPAAAASGSGLTFTATQRWNQSSSQGRWTAYSLTVRNEGAATFVGEVALIPSTVRGMGTVPIDTYPNEYRSSVVVPAGSSRTVAMDVLEGPAGHTAELRDSQGRVVARADPSATPLASGPAVAVLSDVAQTDQAVSASLKPFSNAGSEIAVSSLTTTTFPAGVAALTGLNAIVIDQLDTGALSHDQVQALRDFVGLGGALIEVGGASWRRTLLPLPPELVPMRPDAVASASLTSLAQLSGLTSQTSAQVVTGQLSTGAWAALTSPEGLPLIVQSTYGAGTVVELAFDPFAAAPGISLAGAAWVQAIDRGLGGIQGGAQQSGKFGFAGPGQGGLLGSGPGAVAANPGYMYQIVNGLPAIASPPFGLLVPVLIAYVLVISVGSYLVLRAMGRRGLLWLAVPVLAVVCTSGAYGFGFGSRGSAYQVTEAQVQRVGVDGLVETTTFAGVLAPRRGDVSVSTAPGSLLSTAILYYGPSGPSARDAVVSPGSRPQVLFPSVPVWDVRPVQALTYSHPFGALTGGGALPIEARLSLRQGRIVGDVVNHTSRPLRDLEVVSSTGATAHLVASLPPGATATVDASLSSAGAPLVGKGAAPVAVPVALGIPLPASDPNQALINLGLSGVASRPGELALVGASDPLDVLRVGGEHPSLSGRAVLVEPVRLLSADSLSLLGAPARQVSTYVAGTGPGPVYELTVPAGHTGRVGLAVLPTCCGPAAGGSVEVYNWATGGWRPLPLQSTPFQGPGTAPSRAVALTPAEVAAGVVRVRTSTTGPTGPMTGLTLADMP